MRVRSRDTCGHNEEDTREQPEVSCTQSLPDGDAGCFLGDSRRSARGNVIGREPHLPWIPSKEQPNRWDCNTEAESRNTQVGHAPARTLDQRLRDRHDDEGPEAHTGSGETECCAATPVEPISDHAGIRDRSRGNSEQTDQSEQDIEMPERRRKEVDRHEAADHRKMRSDDDGSRTMAVNQTTGHRGGDQHHQIDQRYCKGDGATAGVEFGCERFDKDAECIDDNRADSASTAQRGNQYDPVAVKNPGSGAMWWWAAHTGAELGA